MKASVLIKAELKYKLKELINTFHCSFMLDFVA
jgi:hypothetical protein